MDTDDLRRLGEQLRGRRPVEWDQLPDFSLYMDQVLSYMDRQVLRFDGDDGLTAAMVNNYTKSGLVPRAEGKKYGREHLAYLTVICVLKRVLSAKDMGLLLDQELVDSGSVETGYGLFRNSLDGAMSTMAADVEEHSDPEKLADAAVHFALLSYAAGVASSRCVSLLRAERGEPEPEKSEKPEKKEKQARQKNRKEND